MESSRKGYGVGGKVVKDGWRWEEVARGGAVEQDCR